MQHTLEILIFLIARKEEESSSKVSRKISLPLWQGNINRIHILQINIELGKIKMFH